MPVTGVRGRQILDDSVTRADINVTSTGNALITKVLVGAGLLISSSTGADSGTGDVTLTLGNSGVTAGSYGSGSLVPVITVDAFGRITAISTASAAGGGTTLNGTGFVRMSGTTPSYITGTSSQFLKADGTLDSSVYALSSALSGYLPLTGGALTGGLNGTTASFSGSLTTSSYLNISGTTAVSTSEYLYKVGSNLYWKRNRLRSYIERTITGVSTDPVNYNTYYEIGSFAFSSLEGVFEIDLTFNGSGYGQGSRHRVPVSYAMDYLTYYTTGLTTVNGVWLVVDAVSQTPRHLMPSAANWELQMNVSANTVTFRILIKGGTAGTATAYVKISHNNDFDNCTYTELTGTGVDATAYSRLPYIGSGINGTTLIQNNLDLMGDLAVGLITPLAKVHISKDGGASTVRLLQLDNSNPTYSQNVYLDMNTSKDVLWGQGSAGGGTFWNAGTRGYGWSINGSSKVTIDLNGNVGIGTSTPLNKLHIYNSVTGSGVERTTPVDVLTLETENTTALEYDGFGQVINFRGVTYTDANKRNLGKIIHKIRDASAGATTFGTSFHFELLPNSTASVPVERVVFDHTGHVGIGITTPTERLHVSGNALVTGSITGSNIISTQANNTANGGGQIFLNGATGNRIDFNINGAGNPTLTTRSAGTKIVFYPQVGAAAVDYAIGLGSASLWMSVADSTASFNWYAANINIASLSGTGTLSTTGQFISTRANSLTAGDGQLYLNGTSGGRIDFNGQGIGNPVLNNRSVGSKIVFRPTAAAGVADWAIGTATSSLWLTLPNNTNANSFILYGGTTLAVQLRGDGLVLTAATGGFQVSGGTSSQFLKANGTLDSNTYLTDNQSITLSGAVSGSGTTAITTTLGTGVVGITNISATGTPDSTTFLRGDGTWATPAGGGGGTTLNGTGFVLMSGTTVSYVTGTSSQFVKADGTLDNSSYYLASNPNGYTNNAGTVTSVGGTGTVSGLTLSGTVTASGNLTLGGTLTLTAANINAVGAITNNTSGSAGSTPVLTSSGSLTTQQGDGTVIYSNALTNGQTGLFAGTDNSNSILTVNRHPGNYYSQLGFSSNGNLYYRNFVNTAINTSQAWQTIWTSTSLTNLNQLTNGPGYITGNQSISVSGDASGSGTTAITLTLATVNSNTGTFNNVTVNAKGLVTAASNVAYLTSNQSITLSGDVTGSGATAISTTIANSAVTYAKIQNVTDNRILGRSAGSAGAIQEISIGSGLSLSSGVLTASAVSSQWITGSGFIYVLSNVGIGSSSTPRGRFETIGPNGVPTPLATAVTTDALIISDSGNTGIVFGNGTTSGWMQARNLGANSTAHDMYVNPLGGKVVIGSSTSDGVGHLQLNGTMSFRTSAATTIPAMRFLPKTNLITSTAQGDLETDANGLLFYSYSALDRGVMETSHYLALNNPYTLTNNTTAQRIFDTGTNGAVSVEALAYEFEMRLYITNMATGNNHALTIGFAVGGGASINSIGYTAIAGKGTVTTPGTAQATVVTTANATAITTSNTGNTAYTFIKGIVRFSAAGTFAPRITLGVASAAIVQTNSYFKLTPFGGSNTTSIGNVS